MMCLSRLFGALATFSTAACAPAGGGPSDAPASNSAAAAEREKVGLLQVEPVADVDPETGIHRNVIYEPEIGPEPQERPRKDPDKTAL